MRQPSLPREGESVNVWARVGYSFFYTDVAVYYTTDGTNPVGSKGVPTGSTQVLRSSASQVSFVRNEPTGQGQVDWWRATLPASTRLYGQNVRYRIGAWHSSSGPEVWANNYGCEDGVCDNPANPPLTFGFLNGIAWPGAGQGQPNPGAGYPPVHHWKEEAVVGNTFINAMLDQNGTVYDIYGPGPGAVRGISTKNEGYVGGLDTFPPGLPPGNRGQMHFNHLMAGIRVDGLTHWMSNPNGQSFSNVTQSYLGDTNVVESSSRLTFGGNNILVQQYDFAPYNLSTWPRDGNNNDLRGMIVKRFILTNNGATTENLDFYVYGDWAINGGDQFDQSAMDYSRRAMYAWDNTDRWTNSTGEYNPTTTGDYRKDVSVYFAAALKTLNSVGGSAGDWATDDWRASSTDQGQGWIATKVTLAPGQSKEVNMIVVNGFDNFPNATGTYNFQIAPVLDWFKNSSMAATQAETEAQWINLLGQGVTVDFPDDNYDKLFKRGILGTMLHFDGRQGGLIAGMHNGAYPFVWPRDAVYGAVTLTRAGHWNTARRIYDWMRNIAYRGNESWGKGFFYQKYTTDGHIIWSAPQVDETAVVPWGLWWLYQSAFDFSDISTNHQMIRDSARAMSEDSVLDSRLYLDDNFNLMHSMNVWEDSFALHLYSNANVVRGLWDARKLVERAAFSGWQSDSTLYQNRADQILSGIRARLAWNGENTDISQLGLVYPFQVIPATDPDAVRVIDRINGVAPNNANQFTPLVRTGGEWDGLIDRYWGDTYWNGGPWFLSTLWYGLYYMERADSTTGFGDIDNHKFRVDRCIANVGPVGFGAEQIAPANSLLYPGQTDFRLQTAWPNAWESMSKFVDALMAFLDYDPDSVNNTLRISPKLPSGWKTMTFHNVRMGQNNGWDIRVDDSGRFIQTTLTNIYSGGPNLDLHSKLPAGSRPVRVTVNGVQVPTNYLATGHRVRVQGALTSGVGNRTVVRVEYTRARVANETTIRN